MPTLYTHLETIHLILKNQPEIIRSTFGSECLAALVVGKFYKKKISEEILIGFPVEDRYAPKALGNTQILGQEIVKYLNKVKKQSTVVDFTLAPSSTDVTKKHPGLNFQVKRFGPHQKKRDTDTLIKFIKEQLANKYGKNDSHLLVLIESGEKIDFPLIVNEIKSISNPFLGVRLVAITQEKKVILLEILPKEQMYEVSINELINV